MIGSALPGLLVITPSQLPGRRCGLADHSRCLAEALEPHGISVTIRGVEALSAASPGPVLVQFTPYAYSSLGLPLRLLLLLLRRRLRAGRRPEPLVVFFHEIPFLNRSGWRGRLVIPLQTLCCILLGAVCTDVLVNQRSALSLLGLLRPFRPPIFLPCWSNVGEADDVLHPEIRPLQVAIFGTPGKRRHAHALVADLGGYRQLFGQEVRVVDIGESGELPTSLRHEVTVLGVLSDAEVRRQLLLSRFGWFYCEPDQVPKSGVFAAYCALGVIPILAFAASSPGHDFLSPSELPIHNLPPQRLQAVWLTARDWFRHHGVAASTARILPLICTT